MIFVDDRIGSADLAPALEARGLPVELVRMDSADVGFAGRGIGGNPVNVGIELKKLPDLLQSIRTGRLAGEQLPKMLGPQGAYDFGWLLVEGQWKADTKTGRILHKQYGRRFRKHEAEWIELPGRMTVAEMQKHLFTLSVCGGLHVHFAIDRAATLHFLTNLFHWWVDKSLDEHRSHITQHTPHGFLPLSDFRDVVSRFPGISVRTSLAVELAFAGNLLAAVGAPVRTWAEIQVVDKAGKPRRIGVKTAERIVAFCRGQQ